VIKSRLTVVLATFAVLAVIVVAFASWALLDDGDADAEDAPAAAAASSAELGPTSSGLCSTPEVSYRVNVNSLVPGRVTISASVYTTMRGSNWSWSIVEDGVSLGSGTTTAMNVTGGPTSEADVVLRTEEPDGTNITFNATYDAIDRKISCTGAVSFTPDA